MGSYLSIITLNVSGLNAPTKRQRLAKWIQNKTHIYAVYKRPTSNLGTHTDWKWRDGKIFHTNGDQKKSGVAILTSDKTDFEIKAMRQRRTLHSDQRINPRKTYNNDKYIYIQYRRTSVHKANANKYERGN